MRRRYRPPTVRECDRCGRVVRNGFATGLYFERYGQHAPCSDCGGRYGPWREAKLSPLPVRVTRLVGEETRRFVDYLRRRLYL